MFSRPADEIKVAAKLIVPVENRTCSPGLEEKEIGSFRSLTWFCKPCMLAWPEEAALSGMKRWTGWGMPDQDPNPFPSFHGKCSSPAIVDFNSYSL